jgi:hypothetical protein
MCTQKIPSIARIKFFYMWKLMCRNNWLLNVLIVAASLRKLHRRHLRNEWLTLTIKSSLPYTLPCEQISCCWACSRNMIHLGVCDGGVHVNSGLVRWNPNFITTHNKYVVYFTCMHHMKLTLHKIILCFTDSTSHSGCIFSSSVATCADEDANGCCVICNKFFFADSQMWHQFHLVVFPHL